MNKSQIKEDFEFLLSFAPGHDVDDLPEGLGPMFYLTGTYEGDYKIVKRISEIVDRYNLETNHGVEEYSK
jgi:hypothetical protein